MKLLQKFLKWVSLPFQKKTNPNQIEVEERPRLSQKKIISEYNKAKETSSSVHVSKPYFRDCQLSGLASSKDQSFNYSTSHSTSEKKHNVCEYPEVKTRTCEYPYPKNTSDSYSNDKSQQCAVLSTFDNAPSFDEKLKKSNNNSFEEVLSETVRSEKPKFNNRAEFTITSNNQQFQITQKQLFFVNTMAELQDAKYGVEMKTICQKFMLMKFGPESYEQLPKYVLLPKYHKKTINHLVKIGVIIRLNKTHYLFVV